MNDLTAHLSDLAAQIEADGIAQVHAAATLGAAMIDHSPVLAMTLLDLAEPSVARERAFGRIAIAAARLPDFEQRRVLDALTLPDMGLCGDSSERGLTTMVVAV